jgi:hypothetical protein
MMSLKEGLLHLSLGLPDYMTLQSTRYTLTTYLVNIHTYTTADRLPTCLTL